MPREKQSSTLSAKAVFETLIENGYQPELRDKNKPLRSLSWGAVITDKNVVRSGGDKSIHMVDTTGQDRPLINLKTKGMMSESSIDYFKKHIGIDMNP